MSVTSKTFKNLDEMMSATTGKPMQWRWYHATLFYVIVQALTFGLSGLVNITRGNKAKNLQDLMFSDVPYFKSLKQSVITPPSWAFGPAWFINNASVLYGTLRVLNKAEGTPGRSAYLTLQAASWLDFVLFNAAYFSLRSPINALMLTMLMFGLTIASGLVAIFQLKDSRVALSLATLFLWLIIASTAAISQALWNRDALYNVGPFAEPAPALVKKEVR